MASSPRLGRVLGRFWWWLRQVSGDAAYENHLERVAAQRSNAGGLPTTACSRREFYLDALRRKYSRINRCC